MLAWSPLLIQRLDLRATGLALHKLQLNRHREAEVAPHSHPYCQLILYLDGEGTQVVRGTRHISRPGELFLIPAGVPHGFSMAGRSRPLCLVLDFSEDRPRLRAQHHQLRPGAIAELHGLISSIPNKGRLRLAHYSTILAVAARLLHPDDVPATVTRPTLAEVRSALVPPEAAGMVSSPVGRPAEVAGATGYHRDTLTRKLKRETGLGLRALRDQQRLAAAEAALREHDRIAEAAAAAGFDDPNYFTRWFRRRTGLPPGEWRTRG